jgi:hypothetical protein
MLGLRYSGWGDGVFTLGKAIGDAPRFFKMI